MEGLFVIKLVTLGGSGGCIILPYSRWKSEIVGNEIRIAITSPNARTG